MSIPVHKSTGTVIGAGKPGESIHFLIASLVVPGRVCTEDDKDVKNTGYSIKMAILSHKECGLDYSPISQKLANKTDVLDQSEAVLHQQKGNTKNRLSKCNEWD